MVNNKKIYILLVFVVFFKILSYDSMEAYEIHFSKSSGEYAFYTTDKSDKVVLVQIKNKVLFYEALEFVIYGGFILSLCCKNISFIINNYQRTFFFDFRKEILKKMRNKFFGTKYQGEVLFFKH